MVFLASADVRFLANECPLLVLVIISNIAVVAVDCGKSGAFGVTFPAVHTGVLVAHKARVKVKRPTRCGQMYRDGSSSAHEW